MYVYVVSGFPGTVSREQIAKVIQLAGTDFELHKVLEEHKALRSHWHFKRAAGTGTLEVTWEGAANMVHVIVHKNRIGADGWALTRAPDFADTLATILGGRVLSQHATNGY